MECKTRCVKSARAGRFKISLLEQIKTFGQPESARDYVPERTSTEHRVAVQYSRKVNGEWKNETIFCSPNDFRNLQNAIEDFHELKEDKDESETKDGDKESPDSSSDAARGDAK